MFEAGRIPIFRREKIKQGTISVLFGCHNIVHSIFVLIAWIILYKRFPKPWQFICIMIHDVGHIGLDYLDHVEEKRKHWIFGAKIGRKLFGDKAFRLLAGHSTNTGYPRSDLYKADKYSWYILPKWVLRLNQFFEPKLKMGMTGREAVDRFKEQVRKSIESGEWRSTHDMYLERCKDNANV